MQFNTQITLTTEQTAHMHAVIRESIGKAFHHPLGTKWIIPELTTNIMRLAQAWFRNLKEKHADSTVFEKTLPKSVGLTPLEQTIITKVFAKVFGVTITLEKPNLLSRLFFCCIGQKDCGVRPARILPKWQEWKDIAKATEAREACTVKITWNKDNSFIAKASKQFSLPDTAVIEAFKRAHVDTQAPKDFLVKIWNIFIPVHQQLLASHSAIFRNTLQNHEGIGVELEGHSPHIVKALIDYLYNGSYEVTDIGDLIFLTRLAHTYEITTLQLACDNLWSKLIKQHFAIVYAVALNFDRKDLLAFCLQYADTKEHLDCIKNSLSEALYDRLAHLDALPGIKKEILNYKG